MFLRYSPVSHTAYIQYSHSTYWFRQYLDYIKFNGRMTGEKWTRKYMRGNGHALSKLQLLAKICTYPNKTLVILKNY
jgi:hypothetical protein